MRTLIRELPYEKPIAGGRYRYERQAQPTGALESWRLSEAAEQYRFLRVDLNAQDAQSGDSYLYHLTLNPQGRPERLSFRFFSPGLKIEGIVLFEDSQVTLTRRINRQQVEDEIRHTPQAVFWFPASSGLSLLAGVADAEEHPALTLNRAQHFSLWPTSLRLETGEPERIQIMGQTLLARPRTLRWADEERKIWLDEHNWPVRMQRGDLWATETRYLRYHQDRIAKDV